MPPVAFNVSHLTMAVTRAQTPIQDFFTATRQIPRDQRPDIARDPGFAALRTAATTELKQLAEGMEAVGIDVRDTLREAGI